MLSRNQQIIRENLESTYKFILENTFIITSITKPKVKTKDLIEVIANFDPLVNRKKMHKSPIIALNYLDDSNLDMDNKIKKEYLKETRRMTIEFIKKSNIFYSLAIDYDLLDDEMIELLKDKYQERQYTLRIIGSDYIINSTTYEKLSFFDEIVVNKIGEDVVQLNSSTLIENNNLVIDNIIPNRKFEPINEFYINRELTNAEISLVVDKINNTPSSTKRLYYREYNPSKYKALVKKLVNNNLDPIVELNFLSNPIHDKSNDFAFIKQSPFPITITYSTNESRIEKLTSEPFSDSHNYKEELECNGKVQGTDYLSVLSSAEFIERKTKSMDLSPLESLVYVYRYIEKNSLYFKENEINNEYNHETIIGYAKFYSILSRRIGIPAFIYTTSGYMKNIIRVQDKKYKLDRIITTDITSDIETDRYGMYKVYSFSYFGLSPLDSLKQVNVDFITIPTSLVLSRKDYQKYSNISFNKHVKLYNITKNLFEISLKALMCLGFNEIDEKTSFVEFQNFISNLQAQYYMKPIESSAIGAATEKIVNEEINAKRHKQKDLEIRNATETNIIGRSELANKYRLLINADTTTPYIVDVSVIKPNNSNEKINNETENFISTATKIMEEIFNLKEQSIIYLKNSDYIVEALTNSLIELYNDSTEYKKLTMNSRKELLTNLYEKFEQKLYEKIDANLYAYLVNVIIPNLDFISNSKELKYLNNITNEEYNTDEFYRNLKRIDRKIKYFIEELSSKEAQKLGISYNYSNYLFTLKTSNTSIKTYTIKLLNKDIITISESNRKKIVLTTKTSYSMKNKIKEYIELYLEKICKYNQLVDNANLIINDIEFSNTDIKSNKSIKEFIQYTEKLNNLEKEISKEKENITGFKELFYNRFNSKIDLYKKVKQIPIKEHIYNKSLTYYKNLINEIETELIETYKQDKNNFAKEKATLYDLIDYIILYLSIRIKTDSNLKVTDLNEFIELKEKTIKSIETSTSPILSNKSNITNRYLNFSNEPQSIKYNGRLLKTIKLIELFYLRKNIKIEVNRLALNRLKKSKYA